MYVGIDVGGTNTRIATSTSLDKPSLENRKTFDTSQSFGEAISNILNAIHQIGGNVEAIGLGVPGYVSADKKAVVSATNLPGWGTNQPIAEIITKEFGCPVFIDNDAIMGALGEAYYGLGDNQDFLYLIWGTGVGGATAQWINGKVVVSKIDWPQYLSKWESLFSGSNIKKQFGKPAENLSEDEWEQIMERVKQCIVGLSKELNQETIVFGGGIAVKQQARILRLVKQVSSPRVLISELSEDTSLYGAFALIKNFL